MVSLQADPLPLASVFVGEPLVGLPLQVGGGASASDNAQERNVRHGVGVDQIDGGLAATPAEAATPGCARLTVRAPVPRFHSIAVGIVERTMHAVLCAGVLLSSNPPK